FFFFLIFLYSKVLVGLLVFWFFFFKQKTAYEMVGSDWSSDVCSSDLPLLRRSEGPGGRRLGVRACRAAQARVQGGHRHLAPQHVGPDLQRGRGPVQCWEHRFGREGAAAGQCDLSRGARGTPAVGRALL